MTKNKRLEIRISQQLREAFTRAAKKDNKTATELITEFITNYSKRK